MSRILRTLTLVLLSVFLFSCMKIEDVELTSINNISIQSLTGKHLKISSEIELNNPNSFDIEVLEADINIFYKKQKLAHTHLDSNFKVLSKSNQAYVIYLTSDVSEIKSSLVTKVLGQAAFSPNGIPIRIQGEIKGKAFKLTKTIKIDQEDIVPIKLF